MTSILDQNYQTVRSNQSSFVYEFKNFDISNRYTHAVITSLSIPKTFYVLPEDSTLVVTENGVDQLVVFEKGNYKARGGSSEQTFMTYFVSKLNSVCSWTYSITYNTNPEIGKYVFGVSGNGGIQPIFTPMGEYLAELLGMANGDSYSFVGNSLESESCINFQAFDKLLILSNGVKNSANILQDIVTSNVPYNSSIVWGNSDILGHGKLLKPLGSNSMSFSLVNVNGDLVNLNGSYWSFVIKFYRVGELYSLIANDIKLRELEREREAIDEEAFV